MSSAVIVLATVLVVVTVLALIIITFLYLRLRRQSFEQGYPAVESARTPSGFNLLFNVPSPTHPASRITPFGTSPERDIFNHEPGKNMRIAQRRIDGSWEFSEFGSLDQHIITLPPRSAEIRRTTPLSPLPESPETPQAPSASTQESYADVKVPKLTVPPPAYSREGSEDH